MLIPNPIQPAASSSPSTRSQEARLSPWPPAARCAFVLNHVWIAGAGCTPLYCRPQPWARSSPCPPPPAAGCAPSPWLPQPACVSRHGQAAISHGGGEFVLEPGRCLAGGSYIQRRGVLHPAAFNVGSCNSAHRSCNRLLGELQEGWLFFADAFFLPNQFFVFAGTDVFFCWIRDNFLLHRFAELSDAQLVFAGT